jgi:glycosyltransferase involved in cell wall biosynthesis
MRMAKCLVTVNRHFEEQLRGWGLPVSVQTCYDGVEMAAPDEQAASVLRASLVPPEGVLIGSVGRLDTQKGYEDLVRAARIVIDARPTVRFAIAGAGPLRARLESLVAELDLVDRFHLLGFRDDVPTFLAALDLFVSSSLWEGLPLVVLEAMLLGKAVVATDVGGNAEIMIPGQTGDLVPPGKPDAMAAALLASLGQKDMLARRAPEVRRVAAALSDPHRSAQNFDEILYGAMNNRE